LYFRDFVICDTVGLLAKVLELHQGVFANR